MDYEKAYKDALERAKAIRFGNPNSATANVVCEEIFPELAESEDERNQRIKKEVVEILHYYHSKSPCFIPPQFSLEETLAWLEKQGEQKLIDSYCKDNCKGCQKTGKCFADGECKAKKEAEQKPAWSDEDEETLTRIVFSFEEEMFPSKQECRKNIDFLNSLKNRVQPQPKQEWSISDERILNNIFTYLGYAKDGNKYCTPELICEAENWLKSLKPQPHWKPTNEQIETLKETIEYDAADANVIVLKSLYNNLKKL